MIQKKSLSPFWHAFWYVLGWAGAVFILVAYFFLSYGVLDADSILYQGLNIVGAAILIPDLFLKKAYESFFLQVVWVFIGLGAILGL